MLTNTLPVLVIPIYVLWQVQINLRQKLILGTTLCLPIFMIVIAIIRLSAVHIEVMYKDAGPVRTVDFVWVLFWLQIEACTAVIMVSFSTFRSVFVAHQSRLRDDQDRHRRWYMSRKNMMASIWRRRKLELESESEEMDRLPSVPRATITRMNTFIGDEKPHDEHATVPGAEAASRLANEGSADDIGIAQPNSTDLEDHMSHLSAGVSSLGSTIQTTR